MEADRAREHARIRAACRFYDSSAAEHCKRDAANPGMRRTAETQWVALWRAPSALALPGGARLLDVGGRAGDDLARVGREFGAQRGAATVRYDTRNPNVWNSHMAAVLARKWDLLFLGARVRMTPETLRPPLARRLGPLTAAAYGSLRGAPPFLRRRYVAESCSSFPGLACPG